MSGEIMFNVDCMMCGTSIKRDVGVRSYRVKIYGSEIVSVCNECPGIETEPLEVAHVDLYCCSKCAEEIVNHMSAMYRDVKGYNK